MSFPITYPKDIGAHYLTKRLTAARLQCYFCTAKGVVTNVAHKPAVEPLLARKECLAKALTVSPLLSLHQQREVVTQTPRSAAARWLLRSLRFAHTLSSPAKGLVGGVSSFEQCRSSLCFSDGWRILSRRKR
jgi:hypothetical protein